MAPSRVDAERRRAPPTTRQQLRADFEGATALCLRMGMRDCTELREATEIEWEDKRLSAFDLATLAKLGSVLPWLKTLVLQETSGSAGPDGVKRLAEGLVAGALPAVTYLSLGGMHVGKAGASAIADALDRGAMPQLKSLALMNAGIDNAALAALAPALRRRAALEGLCLDGNPFGDKGLAALVVPPPAAGTPPRPAGGLKKLKRLYLDRTQITDAGCATLAAALDRRALPALEDVNLDCTPALRAMAFSKLSSDEQGVILGQLRNALEPRLVMYFSSASKELRALLPPLAQLQLKAHYEEATALCVKMGMRDCRELREANVIVWRNKRLSAANLATLAELGPVLPALKTLCLVQHTGSAGPDGVQRLAEGLVAGALPAVTYLGLSCMHVGKAGTSAIAAALDRGAMPQLKFLWLNKTAIGDAALAALAPALRRRPALEKLLLGDNPFGDEGLAALVAPPPPAGTPPRPAGALKKLKVLALADTQVSDAGCATLVAALDSGALPALEELRLGNGYFSIPASDEAKEAVRAALARSRAAAVVKAAGPLGAG